MADLLVFGCRAGAYAAAFAREHGAAAIDERAAEVAATRCLAPLERGEPAGGAAEAPYAIQHELQRVMQDQVGIVRTEAEMREALAAIGRLRERAGRVLVPGNRQYNPGWHTTLDLHNLLTVSEAVARAALERRESRGAHTRVEYPESDKQLGTVNVVIRRRNGQMTVLQEGIPPLPDELKRIVEGGV